MRMCLDVSKNMFIAVSMEMSKHMYEDVSKDMFIAVSMEMSKHMSKDVSVDIHVHGCVCKCVQGYIQGCVHPLYPCCLCSLFSLHAFHS